MKLLNEVIYDLEKKRYFEGAYYNYISFSLGDVEQEDIKKLSDQIKSEVYVLGLLGFSKKNDQQYHFFSPTRRNVVRLEIPSKGLANLFIRGPKAEEIELRVMELISEGN